MGILKLLVAEATQNKVKNPSAETTGNFAAVGAATITRVQTYAARGSWSYRVQTSTTGTGLSLTLGALANAGHYASAWVRGTLPASWLWTFDLSNYHAPTLLESGYGGWSLYGYAFSAAECNASTTLYIVQYQAGSGDFYVDCVQVEQKAYRTTYADGDEPGCSWLSGKHSSASNRTATSRAGGRSYDLTDDYGLRISGLPGLGMPSLNPATQDFSPQIGGTVQRMGIPIKKWAIEGVIQGASLADLHAKRGTILAALKPDPTGLSQPVPMRYSGGTLTVEQAQHYIGGMEAGFGTDNYSERLVLHLLASDPYWQGMADVSATVPTSGTVTMSGLARRSGGTWTTWPVVQSTNPYVQDIVRGPDGCYYVTGYFGTIGGTAAANIAKYDPSSETWSALGTGLNNLGYSLTFDPAGTLFVGGAFGTAGTVAASRVAQWDGVTWGTLTSGVTGGGPTVYKLAYSNYDHSIYVAGNFGTAGTVPVSGIAKWNGTAWGTVGNTIDLINGVVGPQSLAIASDGRVYLGGVWATSPANLAQLAPGGTAWEGVGTVAPNAGVTALAVAPDGILYAGGAFGSIGGVAANRVARWNGQVWQAMGSGMPDGQVNSLREQNGQVYAAGGFSAAGGISVAANAAIWNGAAWTHLDIDRGTVRALVPFGNDLWMGAGSPGAITTGTATTITNTGGANGYPVIAIKRTGGTLLQLQAIANEATGRTIYANYALASGETLTVDLRPASRSVRSDFFGDVAGQAVLPLSDLATLDLIPGDNTIRIYAKPGGTPTVTASVSYRPRYLSPDSA